LQCFPLDPFVRCLFEVVDHGGIYFTQKKKETSLD
jgi:hypothetical protein